jgi:hypothetical protein
MGDLILGLKFELDQLVPTLLEGLFTVDFKFLGFLMNRVLVVIVLYCIFKDLHQVLFQPLRVSNILLYPILNDLKTNHIFFPNN